MAVASRSILAAILVVVGPLPALAQDEASLRAADEEHRRLISASDTVGLMALSHPQMLVNAPNGVILDRDALMKAVSTGEIAKERFQRIPEKLAIAGNVGTVMGHELVVAAKGSRDYKTFADREFKRRYTNVFLLVDGRWRFLSRQAAIVPQAAPAP